jgi:hypothetical protein
MLEDAFSSRGQLTLGQPRPFRDRATPMLGPRACRLPVSNFCWEL